MTRFSLIFVLLLCFCSSAPAAPKPLVAPLPLEQFLHGPGMDGSIAGVEVCDARTGTVLFAHNAGTRLLPASNAKLFTAAAALELLGEQFTWTTKVVSAQKPDAAGVVNGDVYLVGAGDASLVTADMDDLAKQIKADGVVKITGNVYGDNALFTDGPYGFGWEWDDFDDEEFPQISALTIDEGDLTIHIASGAKPGDPVQFSYPFFLYWQINATTEAKGVADDLQITRQYGISTLIVNGKIPLGTAVDRRVPFTTPATYTATLLQEAIQGQAITLPPYRIHIEHGSLPFINLSTSPSAPPDATNVLAAHTSAPLSQYVTHMLKESDNLYAECLVRTVGVQKGTGGSFVSGYAAELPALQKLGVDMTSVTLVDGCGVGRRNFVTARAVCQLLVGMKKSAHYATFYNALPVAGVDGTLKSRMKATPAAANCHAKTGTLGAVRALSGYVTGKSGTPYVFSILLNNFPGTAHQAGAVQDNIVEWLAAH